MKREDFWCYFCAVALITLFSALGAFMGHQTKVQEASWSLKDYEAACAFSDILRIMQDDSVCGNKATQIYNSYFEEFDSLNFESLTQEDLNDYSWSY